VKRMALISLRRYVGCLWHVTQAICVGHFVREPSPLQEISGSNDHWETSGNDASRTIGVLLKSAQTVALSVIEAIGQAVGKPMVAIEALQS